MAVTTLTKVGAFTNDLATQLNDNFAYLSGSTAGGTLADGTILIGNGANVATAVTLSGDVTVTNAGVTAIAASVTLTTPNIGAATGTSVVLSGDCKAATYHVGATAGATAGPFTTISGITVVAGIVTALTGS